MKLNQKELAELIAKIYKSLSEKRMAKKAAGEEVADEFTAEEIAGELAAVVGEAAPSGETAPEGEIPESESAQESENADEGKAAEGQTEIPADFIATMVKALDALQNGGQKSATPVTPETKSAEHQQPAGRKYASLFLTGSQNRDGEATSDFKSRIASMPMPERKKTVYGMFGRAVKCIHASKGDFERAAYNAEHKFNDREMAKEFKALSATVPSDGGYLVPEVYANEIIELLYPATVIYALGARRLGMSNGNLNIPKIKTGSRATFTGENRSISKSAPKFGNLRLSAKKLTALIPMSNDLLRSTNFDNDVIVGQDITKQMALGVDYGALQGTGGEFQPIGIMRNKKVQNIDVTSLDAAYANSAGVITTAFPNYLVAAVLKNNTYADGLGFVFNTSVEQFLKSMRDNVGGFIFAKEMNENHTLVGYPYQTTNLIETDNSKTSIIFGNWNDLVIGEQGALEIETSREGSWTDESGALVSAFENDQTLIRAIDNVDIGLRHEESFAVATKIAVPV